ncbi:MAG: AAA family ATPase, partial [Anaerotignum sp.]|nr:AAA family ATPase [Anaerotignum sp.]
MKEKFDQSLAHIPFRDYGEYMEYLFACVNLAMDAHLTQMKRVFATGQGGYKNVLYPDLEVAADVCTERIERFRFMGKTEKEEIEENTVEDLPEELLSLFGNFAEETLPSAAEEKDSLMTPEKQLELVAQRAEATLDAGVSLPFYVLCRKLEMDSFTVFCFVSGILASTQTDYAAVYQVINENGGLSAPTIESAAKLYFGENFSIAGAYGDMSACLEQLMPVLNLRVQGNMPFSTVVSPDKRMIDFLFGKNPMRLDENYVRFFRMLTDGKELDPIMANENILDAMKISFEEGVRIFSYFGDEGSGRKFFVKHFCQEKGMNAVSVNCKKLFIYDYQYVDQALWAVTRECILTNACCVLDELTFREDEKEKFYGYMDLAFGKLNAQGITVFAISKEKLQMKEITREEFTELELPTPTNQERENCWKYFSKGYGLGNDIELPEMATKFLFTPGKISSALKNARSLATMDKDILIPRKTLFQGCYNQMSSELTQNATKVKANFGFEDIVMNKDQRETLEHAIDQMNFRKKVYDNWDYNKKYPYGRGLSILLFGAPGTGKSMCAQVIAHELNLELYRVDLSKVIDKYVGETEKSISMIFREAKKCNVVLFFDECDTLFAKRSDD